MTRNSPKVALYIDQLDKARCNEDWAAVPELVRKIRKHAADRSCLALTAETEHAISQSSNGGSSISSSTDSAKLERFLKPLAEAIKKETSHVEDAFQGRICLGWLYWILGNFQDSVSHLPDRIESDFDQFDGTITQSIGWTRVCAVKGSYIKAVSYSSLGEATKALEILDSSIPIINAIPDSESNVDQRKWIERLLSLSCVLTSRAIHLNPTSRLDAEALTAFRTWERFGDPSNVPASGSPSYSEFSRREIWKEYYGLLSLILQRGLQYPITDLASSYSEESTRLQQALDLKRVEARYEDFLLKETSFPNADESNKEVEDWVDIVMSNWRILCGDGWLEADLGRGGRNSISRGVLSILYRAAAKTFHSTPILRNLFTLHLAIAEFDIAFKAFDTYLEIVKKGKARLQKTGEAAAGLDDDEKVLITVSDCIRALCKYGFRDAAEKANTLREYLEDWLGQYTFDSSANAVNGKENGSPSGAHTFPTNSVSPKTLAVVWRSIGLSQAQWARLTFEAEIRATIQASSIESFEKALSFQSDEEGDVETRFALALVLAESRDLGSAIDTVKKALLPPESPDESSEGTVFSARFARERSLIPLWHLLALLLSARQDFITASRSCEGAFEQFRHPKNLFGDMQSNDLYRSEHLNRLQLMSISEKPTSDQRGIVDDMDELEKERVLEVKITQLVLLEILEGPEVAVNASDELLSLYTRLFGEIQEPAPSTAKPSLHPPQSSAGTLRSIKGSLFGRSKPSVRNAPSVQGRQVSQSEKSINGARPTTSQTVTSTITSTPTIQVTSENGGHAREPHQHEKLRKTPSLSKKKSHGSLRNRSTSRGRAGSRLADPAKNSDLLGSSKVNNVGLAISGDGNTGTGESNQQLSATPSHVTPPSSNQSNLLQHSSSSLFIKHPVTRFPKEQQNRRRKGVLIKVWLLVAGFYRRAAMHEDAKGAVDEAYKIVSALELEVSKDTSGLISIDNGSWGGGKTVEELWADVLAERGQLEIAQGLFYNALSEFELALVHFADHITATVGLSNILLDIYTEELRPPPSTPVITPEATSTPWQSTANISLNSSAFPPASSMASSTLLPTPRPLGLASSHTHPYSLAAQTSSLTPLPQTSDTATPDLSTSALQPPHRVTTTTVLDRLAARDRAYGLLSALTKLGSAWTCSEAWYALARAYELGGQVEKTREVLWWCVELEEARGVREWGVVGPGGYVL